MTMSESASASEVLVGGTATALSITTTAQEVKVGGTRLSGRQQLWMCNRSNTVVYWSPSNAPATNGMPLAKEEKVALPAGDFTIYVATASGTATLHVIELAGAI
jgi:hypothetical protein